MTIVGAGTTTITASQTGNGNHKAASDVAQTLTVARKGLTGSFTVSDKVYDGTTAATVTSRSLSGGVVGADDVALGAGTAEFGSATVGSGKTITLTGASLTGTNAAHYTLSGVSTATATIQQKVVTLSGLTAVGRDYNGLRAMAISGTPALVGKAGVDDVSLSGSASGLLDTANTGSGKSVTVSGLGLTGAATGNYTLQLPVLSATVTKAPLAVMAANKAKSYDGLAYSGGFSVVYAGWVNGETAAVLGGTVSYSGAALTAVNAGTSAVTPAGLTSSNYEITFAGGELAISKRALTITANSDAKIYGVTKNYGTSSTAFSSAGLVTGETLGTVTITASGGTAAGDATGSYTLVPSAATGGTVVTGNYEITYANGTLVVGAGSQAITFGAIASKVYGDAPFALGATATSGLPVTYTVVSGPATVGGNTLTITGAGTVAVKASQGGDSSYGSAAEVTQTFTVAKAVPAITWTQPVAIAYGAALSAAQLNATASVPGSFTYSPPSGTVVSAGAQTLSVTFTPADTTNYAGASASVTLTVTKAAATVALGSLSATYDGSAKAASATTTPAGLTVDFTYDGSATMPISAASYAVVGTIASTNYQGTASGQGSALLSD